ncbi:MAG: hypothetical protein KAJ19_08300 [Gammaproteobacteria bacterium]|nr:hypothetical protein [Gammaproteobacteria bacterium]
MMFTIEELKSMPFDEVLAYVKVLHAKNHQLKEHTLGYSQETMDAIVNERDKLKAENERLNNLLDAHSR